MDIAQLVTVLTQLGLAAMAWRLANALKVTVDSHEHRINNHETRIEVLERT